MYRSYTYFFFTPRSEQKKERRSYNSASWETEITELRTNNAAVYLQSGWPVTSPGRLRRFSWEVGWQRGQWQCLPLRQGFPCFLLYFQKCCPRCSGALWRASASRLIHQTLGERVEMTRYQKNNADYKPADLWSSYNTGRGQMWDHQYSEGDNPAVTTWVVSCAPHAQCRTVGYCNYI